MIELDPKAIGQRIAHYRRLNGMSARALGEKVGISRAVLANIESGRREDIGTLELLQIAWALGVPPVALVLPIDDPDLWVLADDRQVRNMELIKWFSGWYESNPANPTTPAGGVAQSFLLGLETMYKHQEQARVSRHMLDTGNTTSVEATTRMLEEREHAYEATKLLLKNAGMKFDG